MTPMRNPNIALRYRLDHLQLNEVVTYDGRWIMIRRSPQTVDVYHYGYNRRVCRISGTNRANLMGNVYDYVTTHTAKLIPIYALQFTLEGERELEDILLIVKSDERGKLAA